MRADAPEDRFRDRLVAAFNQPAALLVDTAEVEAKGDPARADRVASFGQFRDICVAR